MFKTKPNPPKSKAIVGKPSYKKYQNIEPSTTMPSFYTKKQP